MFGRIVQPGILLCVKPHNLHKTNPDGGALFVNRAAGLQRLRHCHQVKSCHWKQEMPLSVQGI